MKSNSITELISQNPELNLTDLFRTLQEDDHTEMKEATSLPKSFWVSCSSFTNTEGGDVVLGIQKGEPQNSILGLQNPDQTISEIWNNMSNPNKISRRAVNNDSISKYQVDDKLENTFLRTGDGDRKATDEEISAMLKNTSVNSDSQSAEGMTLDDLDPDTLVKFKDRVSSRFPSHNFMRMPNEDFLVRIGAARKNRKLNTFELLTGTVLMIGKTNAIKELFPHFHLDYFEFDSQENSRWIYRISDNDYLNKEINLYSFFESVVGRFEKLVDEPFILTEDLLRAADTGSTLISLREALINSLIHSDYQMSNSSVRIEFCNGQFTFLNPGQMLIPADEFFEGGNSQPRNEVLMKLFNIAGFSERQGFGGYQILFSSQQRASKLPVIQTDLKKTKLIIWTKPDPSDKEVSKNFSSSSHPRTSDDFLNLFAQSADNHLSFSQLKELTGFPEYRLRKLINEKLKDDSIGRSGKARATYYYLKAKQ